MTIRKWVFASVLALSGAAWAGTEGRWQAENVVPEKRIEDSAKENSGIPAEEFGRGGSGNSGMVADVAQVNVSLTGGVSGYTGELANNSVAGPLFGVTAGADMRGLLGVELGYEASRNPIDDPRVGDNEAIQRHNITAFAKVGPTIQGIKPFLGAGLGASYINVTDGADESDLYRNDIMEELPLGAGVEARIGNLQAGVRGTWRVLFNDEFQEVTPSEDNPGGGLLSGLVTVGGSF